MKLLVDWARASDENNTMELHFQGFMVGELHRLLYGFHETKLQDAMDDKVAETAVCQETTLPSKKRTDITIVGQNVIVILKLKKLNGETAPDETN